MPNWCENTVHFEHTDPKAIKEVKEAFKEEKLTKPIGPGGKPRFVYVL